MKTIHHVLDIDAAPAPVWAALTQAKGLAGWWSTKLDTEAAAVGTQIRFNFATRRADDHARDRVAS